MAREEIVRQNRILSTRARLQRSDHALALRRHSTRPARLIPSRIARLEPHAPSEPRTREPLPFQGIHAGGRAVPFIFWGVKK
jgi:hypothetical protein